MTPSTDPAQPGLVIRDMLRVTETCLIIPPQLIACLRLFDGLHTELDLTLELRRLLGTPEDALARNIMSALDTAGFLENDTFAQFHSRKLADIAANPVRPAVFAGGGYPADPAALKELLASFLAGVPTRHIPGLCAIASPHATPAAAQRGYAAAYSALGPELRERTFIILGTSHYGAANRFGLISKPYQTPLGTTRIHEPYLRLLAREPAAILDDYCHAIEHSIEFQILFLQSVYGPDISVLPILCGSFHPSIHSDGMPEDDPAVRSFFEGLAEIAAREAQKTFWILGVDMAHIGRRYGDAFAATAETAEMLDVRARDSERMDSLISGNAVEFWQKVKVRQDDIKWCGASPFYTFLRTMPEARAQLAHYEQWQIDPQSVVSYAGMTFAQ